MESTLLLRILENLGFSKRARSPLLVAKIIQEYYESEDLLAATLLSKREGYYLSVRETEWYKVWSNDSVDHYLDFLNDQPKFRNRPWVERKNANLEKIMGKAPWQVAVISIAYAIDEIEQLINRGADKDDPSLAEASRFFKLFYSFMNGWKEVDPRMLDRLKKSILKLNLLL